MRGGGGGGGSGGAGAAPSHARRCTGQPWRAPHRVCVLSGVVCAYVAGIKSCERCGDGHTNLSEKKMELALFAALAAAGTAGARTLAARRRNVVRTDAASFEARAAHAAPAPYLLPTATAAPAVGGVAPGTAAPSGPLLERFPVMHMRELFSDAQTFERWVGRGGCGSMAARRLQPCPPPTPVLTAHHACRGFSDFPTHLARPTPQPPGGAQVAAQPELCGRRGGGGGYAGASSRCRCRSPTFPIPPHPRQRISRYSAGIHAAALSTPPLHRTATRLHPPPHLQALNPHPSASRHPPRAFVSAGPLESLYWDPTTVRAAIVTCGGLCPGLNTVSNTRWTGWWGGCCFAH